MSYSEYGRESNVGPWVSEIRYASTSAKEFNPSSLGGPGVRWRGRAYRRHDAPLFITDAGALGGYGDTYGPEEGLGLFGIKISLKNPFGPNSIFGKTVKPIIGGIPIVGPAIAQGIEAFQKRATGAALEQIAQNPGVQAAVAKGAQAEVSTGFNKIAPYAIAGLAALLLLRRR